MIKKMKKIKEKLKVKDVFHMVSGYSTVGERFSKKIILTRKHQRELKSNFSYHSFHLGVSYDIPCISTIACQGLSCHGNYDDTSCNTGEVFV